MMKKKHPDRSGKREGNYSHFLLLSPTTVPGSNPRTTSGITSSSSKDTRVFLRHGTAARPAAAVPHDIADMSARVSAEPRHSRQPASPRVLAAARNVNAPP